ncbi:MAG: hypothetical protein AAFS07_19080, partial [Pseudomonadota bacterium]
MTDIATKPAPEAATPKGDLFSKFDGMIQLRESILATGVDDVISVSAGDLDGDDDLDVVTAGWYGHAVHWFENNGHSSPTFT